MSNSTSERLRLNVPKILAQWEEQAYKCVLSSYGLTSLVLNNAIHSFLENIADALATTIETTDVRAAEHNANILNFAKVHGGGRATEPLHYTLAEVIMEFQILHRVVLEVLEDEAPVPIADRRVIASTIDTALSAAATQFTAVHQEIQEQYALTLVHDLRSPINYVKLSAHFIAQDASASKESLHVAGKINKHMDRLEIMLKELLDVSRVRAGLGLAFEFEAFRLDVLAAELVQEMKAAYGERFELHADEPAMGTWNRDGLRRVFENLVINALKYGSPGTMVKVTVTQSPSHAVFTVHNEGNPISFEERPKLFAKFQRASTAAGQTGWGLGLALVNGMVTAHRGTVRVESSPETGTDFIVELPKKPYGTQRV